MCVCVCVLQSHCRCWLQPWNKRRLVLGRKAMFNLDSILKNREITLLTMIHLVKAVFFSSSHVWMWKLDCKESWVLKNWCFWSVVLEKTFESPMNRSMPDLPVHHQLLEFTQTLVRWVGDAIQLWHHLLSSPSPAFYLSQHQGLFKWVSSSHQVAKILAFQLQHQSFQWTPRTDFL